MPAAAVARGGRGWRRRTARRRSRAGGGFFAGRRPPGRRQRAPAPRGGTSNYQFGGEYWVVALRGDQTVPVAVKTGLTDLEYSEIVSGLEPGDRVLLLPSTSLYEQQERLAAVHQPALRLEHAVPAGPAAEHPA